MSLILFFFSTRPQQGGRTALEIRSRSGALQSRTSSLTWTKVKGLFSKVSVMLRRGGGGGGGEHKSLDLATELILLSKFL